MRLTPLMVRRRHHPYIGRHWIAPAIKQCVLKMPQQLGHMFLLAYAMLQIRMARMSVLALPLRCNNHYVIAWNRRYTMFSKQLANSGVAAVSVTILLSLLLI